MAINYFENFNNIIHTQTFAKNILSRSKFVSSLLKNEYALLPYEIKEGERPDTIAHEYYGDARYAWLVYLSNEIYDPYYDWYLSQTDFDKYIAKKYGSVETAMATILHYQNNWSSSDSIISVAAYESLIRERKKYWEPILVNNIPFQYQRKRVDWKITKESYNNAYSSAANSSGTVSVSNTSATVTGTGTAFSNTFVQGQYIKLWSSSQEYSIKEVFSVNSNTSITLSTNSDFSNTSANYAVASNTFIESIYYDPVYAYEYELEQNEKKKHIKLLSKQYLGQVEQQLRESLNV